MKEAFGKVLMPVALKITQTWRKFMVMLTKVCLLGIFWGLYATELGQMTDTPEQLIARLSCRTTLFSYLPVETKLLLEAKVAANCFRKILGVLAE